jgi:2-(1,2-epoxy-1,2-dihydrophenyl)acetyl-CoA isomerase
VSASPRHITVETAGASGRVRVVTLRRPERANAITAAMARELSEALDTVLADTATRAIVLTGAGDTFSPGADATDALELAERAARGDHPAEPFGGILRGMQEAVLKLHQARTPTVAAINGSAAAGALDLALACDVRIAADSANFAESYVRLALPPLNGSAWLLPRLIGRGPALRMLLTGMTVDAPTALQMGFVDELAPAAEVLDRAVALAEKLSAGAPEIVAFIKRQVAACDDISFDDALAAAYRQGVVAVNSEAYRTAVNKLLGARAKVPKNG